MVAHNAGLDWSHQHGIALGSATAAEPALASGRADLVSVDSRTAQQILDKGTGYVVLNTNDPADALFPYQHTGNCIAATDGYLDSHLPEVEAVVRAELRGLRLVQQKANDPEAMAGLLTKAPKLRWDPKEWRLVAPAFTQLSGSPDAATIADTKTMAAKMFDLKPNNDPAASSFTTEFVDSAYHALGVQPR